MGGFLLMLPFALFFFGFAGWLLMQVSRVRGETAAAATWPEARATVLVSQTKYIRQNKQTRRQPAIEYAYEVSGRTYRGNRITLFDRSLNDTSGEIVGRYPVGAETAVRYDPKNPSRSVLEPTGTSTRMWLAAAAVMLVIGIGFVIAGIRLGWYS